MERRPAAILVLAALCGLVCSRCDCGGDTVYVDRTVRVPVFIGSEDVEFAPDEVLVRFDPTLPRAEAEATVEVWGGSLADDPEADPEDVSAAIFLAGTYRVRLPAGMSVDEALGLLALEDSVDFVEPNYVYEAIRTPDDTLYGRLWGMPKIGAPTAWDRSVGSLDVVVGVIDTGVDSEHPDLVANTWTNESEVPGNGLDDDGNGYVDDIHGYDFCNNDGDPHDDHYHGTHCAGTVAGVGDNGEGVAGVTWQARIMALKFLCSNGSGYSSAAALAIRYAADNGATLTSNSWGGGGYSTSLRNAIQYGMDKGQLFVAAAGNSNVNNDVSPHYPSSYDLPNLISVAASDSGDRRAGFSCYGAVSVDLAAPGVSIYSTMPNRAYGYLSGTSMATPHVAGAAALVHAYNPTLGWEAVRDVLLGSVDVLGSWDGVVATGGRLNVARAIEEAGTPPEPPTGLAAEAAGGSAVRVRWDASADETVTGYEIYYRTESTTPPAREVAGRETTTDRLTGLPQGSVFVALAAVGLGGESSRTDEVVVRRRSAPSGRTCPSPWPTGAGRGRR